MEYQIFQVGQRVRVSGYGPFRGLRGTISDRRYNLLARPSLFCFYLIDLEGAQTKEPVWFEYEEVESISSRESDHLKSA